jgi:hypothetical protein
MENETVVPGGHYAETVKDMLEAWDKGETIYGIEMGGLGPGYEQAIQLGIVELCRAMLDETDLVEKVYDDYHKKVVEKYLPIWDEKLQDINNKFQLGLSGAQAGAIKSIAYRYITKSPREVLLDMDTYESDRVIMVSNDWPGRTIN